MQNIGGKLSLWLLSSPSKSRIGRLPLLVVTSICCAAILLTIAFGAVQWSLAGRMSETLNRVISENLHVLSISQQMTSAMGNAHRFTISAAIANTDEEKRYVETQRNDAFEQYARLLGDLKGSSSSEVSDVVDDYKLYKTVSDGMYEMMRNGRTSEALEYRTSTVRPAFEAWQEAQTGVGNELFAKANVEKQKSQKLLLQMSLYLVWAIVVPILIAVACLIGVIVLIAVQMTNSTHANSRDIWGT